MLHHLYSSFHNPYAEGYEFLRFVLIAVFAFLSDRSFKFQFFPVHMSI